MSEEIRYRWLTGRVWRPRRCSGCGNVVGLGSHCVRIVAEGETEPAGYYHPMCHHFIPANPPPKVYRVNFS